MKLNLSSLLQCRFNLYLCKKNAWRITFFYIKCLGKIYFFFKRKEKRNIKEAVKIVFGGIKSGSEIKLITRNIFQGIFSHYYEKFFNAYTSPETLRAFIMTHMKSTSTSMATIKKGLSRGRGVLLVTGHVGGVELIPAFLGSNGCPVTIVARFSSSSLRKGCIQQAGNFSTRIIDADNTPNIMKSLFNNLKENRVVITQCDEVDEWRPSPKNRISFLGKEINLDRTINIISKRVGATVVFGIMHRAHNHQYKFIAASMEEIKKEFKQLINASVGETVLKYLEQYIYNHPEGWYQWKKHPAMGGEDLSSSIMVEKSSYMPQLTPYFTEMA